MPGTDGRSYSYGHSGIVLTEEQLEELQALYETQRGLNELAPDSAGHVVPLYAYLVGVVDQSGQSSLAVSQVRAWLEGAADVNSDSGVYSDFIRGYTAAQYEYRYGSALPEKSNSVSNGIGLKLVEGILNNAGVIPSIEGLAVFDAGEAAQGIFEGKYFPDGDYAGWAGTLLFPFLGYNRIYSEWLLTDNYVFANLDGRTTYVKNLPGTYDLIAAIQGTQEIYENIGLQGQLFAYLKNLLIDIPQQFDQLKSITNTYLKDHYSLPLTHRFDVSPDLPFAGLVDYMNQPFIPDISYSVGTLGNDVLRLDRDALKGIVNAGSGDDVILANPDGGDWIIDAYNASNHVPTPEIKESLQDKVLYSGWITQYGTGIQLDMEFKHIANSNYSHYLSVEKTLQGAALLGKDIIYDADLIGGSIGSDVLRLTNDDFAPAGSKTLDTVDLHSSGGIGDTVDFSKVDINLNVAIGVGDKHGELLINNSAVLVHTLKGVENIIGTEHSDVIQGGSGNNTLVGLGGVNVLSGGGGADKFVVGQMGAHDIILDAQANDTLYLRSATNELIPLNVGFLPYAKIEGDINVALSPGGSKAFFNPMQVTNPVYFVSDVGAAKTPLSEKVGNGVFIKYGLQSNGSTSSAVNDLRIDIYYLDSQGGVAGSADVLVKNYKPDTLGIEFRKLVEPNYALADYAHPSSRDMQVNIENYENAHRDVLNATLPFHFADTPLDFWLT